MSYYNIPQIGQSLEIIDQFKRALEVMGKTDKKLVVLAPTRVAALNVKGQTIHSFFGFKPDITLQKIKKLDKENTVYKSWKR